MATPSLYKFFKKTDPNRQELGFLPDPEGELSTKVPKSIVSSANEEVKTALEHNGGKKRTRGTYDKYTPQEKDSIARQAIENGVTNTLRKYNEKMQDRTLKESTIRTWVKTYKQELALMRSAGVAVTAPIAILESKRRGRPLLLGEDLDRHTQEYITELRRNGGVVNTDIVLAAAMGIVKKIDANLLEANGGHISISREWAKGFLRRMGFVKRRANTKSKVSVEEFEKQKAQFNFDISVIMVMESVPDELVINWDHTGVHYVPTSDWTMAAEGSDRVEIVGLGDKRQITAVLACTLSGDFLPPQIIYAGRTPRCLPAVSYPKSWHITYTENHWANEKTTIDHINNILLPYIDETRRKLSLPCNQSALVIFDRFKGQCTPAVLKLLSDNNVQIAIVPANLTDRLQPLDISVNKAVKDHLRKQFSNWYSEQVCSKIHPGQTSVPSASFSVDLSLSALKPMGVKWLVSMHDYFKCNKEIIINGFLKAGITCNKSQ